MGKFYSKINYPLERCAESVAGIIKRKRKRNDDSDDEKYEDVMKEMYTPQRKKLLTTPQYIFQTLFKQQRDSDVTVRALGKEWHLHKVYLGQSSYFACMFSGSWRETNQRFVTIEILDPNINHDALEIVFGSLYSDEVTIDPKTVVSVLAAARLFQLDGLIEQCAAVMVETVNAETSLPYYDAACRYGILSIKQATHKWLLVNLLSYVNEHIELLAKINGDLMTTLILDANLFVLQTEFSLYLLLRHWLFLQLFPDNEISAQKTDHFKYFSNRSDSKQYLLTSYGRRFLRPFHALRIEHLLNHPTDLKIIIEDNIIPTSWLNVPLFTQWSHMLRIDQALDDGPEECDINQFESTCLRCGRILKESGFQKWRWTGFNFGLDLILTADTKSLSIKRYHRNDHERLLSLQNKRKFFIRVTISSLNEQRQVKHSQTTGIISLSLDKNEEIQLIQLDSALQHPLLISVNMQIVSPKLVGGLKISPCSFTTKHLKGNSKSSTTSSSSTDQQPSNIATASVSGTSNLSSCNLNTNSNSEVNR